MKKILLAILLFIVFDDVNAQNDSLPIYKRFPVVPVFSIMTVPDSTKFSKDDLKKKTAVIIILFSPDCSHCQLVVKDLVDHIDLFEKTQIVMVSSMDFINIKNFYTDYKIANQPNITMGRDGAYLLGTFYKIKHYPSVFVYDKKQKFVKEFEGEFTIQQIAEVL